MKHKLIDLFSGCGGMTLGFVHPDFCGKFESVFALDNDPAAVDSYRANFGDHAQCGDIEEWVKSGRTPKADIVIGGPPCQGFSLLNKKRRNDHRRALWEPYMDIVALSGARVFVIENVQGLLKSEEFGEITTRADELGFETTSGLLNAADYGAPQTRKRAFIIGWKRSEVTPVSFPPQQTHTSDEANKSLPRWRTVRDMIADLPEPEELEIRNEPAPLNLHFRRNPTEKSMMRYRAVPPGGNRFDLQKNRPDITPQCWIKKTSGGTDLFGRLWWDRPSVTIRTEFFKPEKGRYLHPEQHRPITHREAARLMGFPDEFIFTGTKIEIARQIGNAVPPDMAAAVAEVVAEVLRQKTKKAA
ncbi:DNA (cytosine-5)-methyltransferase 1 [Paucidesulfovibrio gracilis DSM 16080]|uniref:Cytosine-specific methyltransferase n=1 Tax=Paucidesulfovibrio gracilis DSM 16080 TaxID=1121449 RepID=A0A1T4Y4J7_9BACT|nr:DNA cytosine methyltransferase [Paucidesulfovibrio gracilis]SKA96727.1 DNA (cytosine-5)-methyltransferase 1 [Paucidesulfovibrio gracilis DSM 16080]